VIQRIQGESKQFGPSAKDTNQASLDEAMAPQEEESGSQPPVATGDPPIFVGVSVGGFALNTINGCGCSVEAESDSLSGQRIQISSGIADQENPAHHR
jgi:hypothetical protein